MLIVTALTDTFSACKEQNDKGDMYWCIYSITAYEHTSNNASGFNRHGPLSDFNQ